jgi:crotonobetainyl-CoA:carnitine CoA-transferase CaiB-like acyl-CoA transferase
MYAAQLLADFGADVVVVEPPSGSSARRIPPFLDDVPGPDRGLLWASVNRGKRSCTLDPATPDGRVLLTGLAARFDVVLYDRVSPFGNVLEAAPPASALCCVFHPFDPDGPKADYVTTELVLAAASGAPALAGRPIDRPLFFPTPQSPFEIGSDAAVAVMSALVEPGAVRPDRIDINQRGAMLAGAFSEPLVVGAAPAGALPSEPSPRRPGLPNTYRCSDGYVQVSLVFGTSFDPKMTALATWLADLGVAPVDYPGTPWASMAGCGPEDERVAQMIDWVTAAVAARTRAEVTAAGAHYGFFAAPVHDMADVMASERFHRRGAFAPVEHPLGGSTTELPLSFARITEVVPVAGSRPPRIGEHTTGVLSSLLGLDHHQLSALYAQEVI